VEVTLLAGGATAAQLPSAALLHPAVEYHVATDDGSVGQRGDVLGLVTPYLSWADQMVASLPRADYEPLLALVRRHTLRLRPGFAQALLGGEAGAVPCATGACDGCSVRTRDGYRRLCREGPSFDLRELVG
jgi:dihydroorotate dehydrogenase electron transfer subunit